MERFPRRCFLTADWNGDMTAYKEISAKYSLLFQQCKELGIPDLFDQGVIFLNQGGTVVPKVLIEVPNSVPRLINVLYLDAGEFNCTLTNDEELFSVLELPPRKTVLVLELFDLKVEPRSGLLEIETAV